MATVSEGVLLYLSGSVFQVTYKSAGTGGRGARADMDMKVIIMMGCVLCTTSGLCFMELRRIRKKINAK
jgi:hypothetical protein